MRGSSARVSRMVPHAVATRRCRGRSSPARELRVALLVARHLEDNAPHFSVHTIKGAAAPALPASLFQPRQQLQLPVRAPSPALFAPPVKMLANRASQMSRVRPFAAVRPTAAGPVRVVAQAAAANADAKAKKVHPSPLNVAAPSTYAIIEVSGTQMFVEPGKWYTVNRLKADVGAKIKFGRVLALKNEDKLTVGMPYLDTVNVSSPCRARNIDFEQR
eukprot:331586-Chlamydomonas_euryale.AAC.8